MRKVIPLLLLIVVISLAAHVSAADANVTKTDAKTCIDKSQEILLSMVEQGFNVQRVNDTLNQAILIYYAQTQSGQYSSKDFSSVIKYCNDISKIQKDAIAAEDSFYALMSFYNITITSDMNSSSLDSTIFQIREEIKNERYENVQPLIDQAYTEITQIQAAYTTLNVIYNNTTKSFKLFFEKNWQTLSGVILFLLIFYIAYRTKISKWIIERKITSLEVRKRTIKKLIEDLQANYFHSESVSESEYNIKTKKFAELIRDIDRQIPLLYEQLAKLDPSFKKNLSLKIGKGK